MEWVEVRGETLEAAKEEALDQLGVARDDAEFEIVQEAESRWMGLKKTEARVRARVRPTQPRPKETGRGGRRSRGRGRNGDGRGGDRSRGGDNKSRGGQQGSKGQRGSGDGGQKGGDRSKSRNDGNRSQRDRSAGGDRSGGGRSPRGDDDGGRSEAPAHAKAENDNTNAKKKETAVSDHAKSDELVPIDEQQAVVAEFLEGVVEAFGLTGSVSTSVDDEETITGSIEGTDLGLLIGPQGGTLRAIQELSRSALQRQASGRNTNRSRVDVAGYRERRRAALAEFAQRQAQTVLDDGVELALEPMNSADRKAIHDAIMEIDGVRSISEGDDPRRRVVLLPDD